MHISYLAEHPHLIPTLAEWHHAEWAHLNPGDTVEARISRMQSLLAKEQVPTAFVALEGETLLGSASLIDNDMDTRKDLRPWLASVYVAPEFRDRGVGSALVQRVVDEARALAVETLYLFTPDRESLYARMGWLVIERTEYRGEQVVVMELPISTRKK